jgi:hypothetical protein
MRKIQGQLFSTDFLLALILVIFAIGFLVQTVELNAYNLKEKELDRELERIALAASQRLVSGVQQGGVEKILCELVDSGGNSISPNKNYVLNCIDSSKAGSLTKNDLGIPADFKCKVTAGTTSFANCNGIATGQEENIKGIERKVAVHSGSLKKGELEKCMGNPKASGTCTLAEGTLKVLVWR